MTALIVLSHGSRHPRAAGLIEQLARAAHGGAPEALSACAAHLEFNDPNLERCAVQAREAGARRGIVVPLLFTDGYHSRVDVPRAVSEASAASGVELAAAPGLGSGESVARCIARRVERDAPESSRVVLAAVGSSDEAANQSVRRLAGLVAGMTGRGGAGVVFATRGGVEDLMDQVRAHGRVHVVPLFVTHGLLLDRLVAARADVEAATGGALTFSQPLGTDLAEVVARRFREALSRTP